MRKCECVVPHKLQLKQGCQSLLSDISKQKDAEEK